MRGRSPDRVTYGLRLSRSLLSAAEADFEGRRAIRLGEPKEDGLNAHKVLKGLCVLMSAIPVGGEVMSIDTMEFPDNNTRLSLSVDDGERLNECHMS